VPLGKIFLRDVETPPRGTGAGALLVVAGTVVISFATP
jgi:hypothetical protein